MWYENNLMYLSLKLKFKFLKIFSEISKKYYLTGIYHNHLILNNEIFHNLVQFFFYQIKIWSKWTSSFNY